MQFKKDSLPLGIALGLIGPWVGVVLYYFSAFSRMTLKGYFNFIFTNHSIQSPIASLCLIINLAVYYFFYHYKCDKTTKGILLTTFIYAPFVVYLKFR